jgi:hypothetical protein
MKLKKLAGIGFGCALVSFIALACKSEDPPPQQGGYPQQTQPAGVGQPPPQAGYGQPAAAPAAAPAPAPAAVPAPAPAAAAPLSPPGPLALPCSSDANCGLAHCNVPAGKCVFPCQADSDCIAPNHCIATLCVPAMPGQ